MRWSSVYSWQGEYEGRPRGINLRRRRRKRERKRERVGVGAVWPPVGEGSGKNGKPSRQGHGGRPQGPQPRIHAAPAPTRGSFVRLPSGGRTRYFARGEGGK